MKTKDYMYHPSEDINYDLGLDVYKCAYKFMLF